jgi:Domain of unknown function (DUF4124)
LDHHRPSVQRLEIGPAQGHWPVAVACALVLMGGLSAGALAASGIYVCVDAHGKRITSDRPIPECLDREQRLLNKDGSQRGVVGPRVTAREKAEREEAEHQRALAEQAHKDAVRRDRNLMGRYPTEAVHNKARQAALDDVNKAMASSQKRIAELKKERKALDADAEFYKGRTLPFKLKASIDGNQASQQAQQDIVENHEAEKVRITALFDTELARLRKLWAGVAPGSIPDEAASAASVAGR